MFILKMLSNIGLLNVHILRRANYHPLLLSLLLLYLTAEQCSAYHAIQLIFAIDLSVCLFASVLFISCTPASPLHYPAFIATDVVCIGQFTCNYHVQHTNGSIIFLHNTLTLTILKFVLLTFTL